MTDLRGDRELAREVRERLGQRHPVFAVATVSAGERRVATAGAELAADFEIGSITKGITGLLYADALARGELAPVTTLGELWPLGQIPVAGLSLEALSTHHSGLPRLLPGGTLRKSLALWRHGANPYGETLEHLLANLNRVRPKKPRFRYSNLGYQLLGHALAHAAGTNYPDLLRQRIAEPLGLSTFSVPSAPDQLRPGVVLGRNRAGRPQQPWTGEAIGPAGGIRASIEDLATLTAALLDGSAPGCAALDPVLDLAGPKVRIGAAWFTQVHGDRRITWHNGGTGGFRTWLGLDRAAGTGVALLSATSVSVDRQGLALLAQLSRGA